MVLYGQSNCVRVKRVVIGQKWLNSGKVVVIGPSGCIRAKWLYSGKVVVFGKKRLYSGKVALFGQNGCIRGRWIYLSKSGCNRKKVVVFGQ